MVAVAAKLPLVERRARTVVSGARFEAHAQRRTAVKPDLSVSLPSAAITTMVGCAVGTAGSADDELRSAKRGAISDADRSILSDFIAKSDRLCAIAGKSKSNMHSSTQRLSPTR